MNSKLYLECYTGISGDMMVAALLDLGADQEVLKKALQSLPLDGFEIKIRRVKKSGLDACDFAVILDAAHENHDHDMDYLHGVKKHAGENPDDQVHEDINSRTDAHTCGQSYGHTDAHTHDHTHGHTDAHTHDHTHSHTDVHTHDFSDAQAFEHAQEHPAETVHEHAHRHSHEHRGLQEILEIIEQSAISENAKALAGRIFQILAKAEAKAHGVDINQVHFHEVGAVDSIVDIVAAAVCLDNLGIKEVIVPVLYEGTGVVQCQHGIIPIPVPAVANIISDNKLKLHITGTEGEFVTPTGAAIAAAIKTSHQLPGQFLIEKIGLGAGKRNYERASILRAIMIQDNY